VCDQNSTCSLTNKKQGFVPVLQASSLVAGQWVIVGRGRRDINRACNSVKAGSHHSWGGWRHTEPPYTATFWQTRKKEFIVLNHFCLFFFFQSRRGSIFIKQTQYQVYKTEPGVVLAAYPKAESAALQGKELHFGQGCRH